MVKRSSFLGPQISYIGQHPLMAVAGEKRLKYRGQILDILKQNRLSAADADSVCGRLLF